MNKVLRGLLASLLLASGPALFAQIDPEKRQLIQIGYSQAVEGKAPPISAYAFYYRNDPGFIRTNMTLRLAIAPVYLDSELAFSGPNGTALAVGVAGGGFADGYWEIDQGKYLESESFEGHGAEISFALYHCFNRGQLIPLNGVIRASPHYTVYNRGSDTSPFFVLPEDRGSLNLRTGMRLGGMEPTIFPKLGVELSAWYEGQFRGNAGTYGFGDRKVENTSHLFWGRALFIYTLPKLKHNFGVTLTMGTSIDADRFSAYRLGGVLPLASEFPLILPGYYYKEISASRFALLSGQYTFPLDKQGRWLLTTVGSIGKVAYLTGLEQPGRWHSGVGIGLGYLSRKEIWRTVIGYSYGFEAIRDHGRGAQSIGLLFQWDLEARYRTPRPIFDFESPYKSRGMFKFFGK